MADVIAPGIVTGLPIVRPRVVFYSERVGGRPFCRCMSAANSTILRFAGFDVPKDFSVSLYEASGVGGCGMSFNDVRRGLNDLLPGNPVEFGQLALPDLWKFLRVPHKRNRYKGLVHVTAHMSRLPYRLQKLVGTKWISENPYPNDLHGIALAGKRFVDDGEVLWMDPMGAAWSGYSGTWEPWGDVKDALATGSKGVKAAWAVKASA